MAISAAVQRRPIVLVLGMHRSGTSLCSHILSALGVDMTDKIPGPGHASPTPDNPRGHWERWEIVEFHDRILALFNRDYLARFHDFPLPVAWWADPRVAQIRREMTGFLEARMGDGPFGFKDPRTVRLMPVWLQIFNELKLAPKIVLCLRNPAQVARSLQARDGLDPEIGEYRWLVHIVDFFRYANSFDACTVEYEEWFSNPSANIEKLQKFLDLPWQQSDADLALVLSGIIDPAARHDSPDHREASQPLVRTLYKLARSAGEDGGARDRIASIVSQFVSFQQLQRPFIKAFEDVANVAAKYSEIERQATVLQATVGERDATVAAAGARADAAEGRLAEAVAEVEQQRVQIAELAKQCDEASGLKATLAEHETAVTELSRRADELLAALQAAQEEAAAHGATLRHAEQEAQERGAAAAAIEAEKRTLLDALAQAEREAHERASAAAALQAEALAQWDALAQAADEAQGRAAAADAMRAEIVALRETLAGAEREAHEQTAAAEAMRAEVAALHEALAQAERTGQQRAVTAEAIEAELVALRDELAKAEQAGQERAVAGKATQRELAALRGAVALADREAQERADRARTLFAEVGVLREALAQAELAGRQRTAAAGAMQSEIAELRAALAQVEGAAQERSAAAGALKVEVEELRERLAQAEGGTRERGIAAAALEAEVGALRERLAQAEGEARERAAASVAALRAEIVALQGTLTAARQVGRAAIAAFRIDTSAPAQPDQPRGWRQAISKFFRARPTL